MKIKAPSKVVFSLRKLKTILLSLKPKIENHLKSRVVYQIKCSNCDACYVGQTSQHLITHIKEHANSNLAGGHFRKCNVELLMDNVSIITSAKTIAQLMIREALVITSLKPILNRKDKYFMRTLSIKL